MTPSYLVLFKISFASNSTEILSDNLFMGFLPPLEIIRRIGNHTLRRHTTPMLLTSNVYTIYTKFA
jgi:hypothetical protein